MRREAYLTKTSAPEELVRAARKVLAGGKYLTESLAERLADALDVNRQGAPHEASPIASCRCCA